VRVPRLHVICPDAVLARPGFPDRAAGVLAACGEEVAVHLRPRELPASACLDAAHRLARAAEAAGGWLVVNGRVDLALAAGAQGVQLGRGALPIGAARRLLPDGVAIGASVHAAEEARVAAEDGADFLLLGTIYPTPSHPGLPAAGPGRIEECAFVGRPLIAIGGIDAARVPEVLRAGAHGVAVIRAVWEAREPGRAASDLRDRLVAPGAEVG
jgi:thiamine-phosphate pyrophosphorylase